MSKSGWKFTTLMLLSLGVSYSTTLSIGVQRDELIRDVTLSFVPPVVGLVIAAVGVFLGGLAGVSSGLTDLKQTDVIVRARARVSNLVDQMKENTQFSLASLAGIFVARFFRSLDIRGFAWPTDHPWLTKVVVCDAVSLALSILVFIAIWDCIGAMFATYKLNDTITQLRVRSKL